MGTKGWNVLVIEDEGDSMEFVQGMLDHHGIESVGATSGEEAVNLLKTVRPTLIIIDLALPGLDGWGLLKHIQTTPHLAQVPCVAMTAFHTPELAEQAIAAGFSAYFPKPLDATSFVRELEHVAAL